MPIQLSLLRPFDIVFGKIASSVMLIVLLVLATMPVLMVPYMIGGIRFSSVVGGLASIVLTAFVVSAVSVLISTLTKSSVVAIILSYGIVCMFFFGLAVMSGIMSSVYLAFTSYGYYGYYETPLLLQLLGFLTLSINPFVVLAHGSSIAAVSGGILGSMSESLSNNDDFLNLPKSIWLGFHLLVVGILAYFSVRWACRRLRLPAKK